MYIFYIVFLSNGKLVYDRVKNTNAIMSYNCVEEKMNYYDIRDTVIQNGIIDETLAQRIQSFIFSQQTIDINTAKILFELHSIVSGKDNSPIWKNIFSTTITQVVLEDEESPGVVDDEETIFIKKYIGHNDIVDDVELELLVNILEHAHSCSDAFIAYALHCLHQAIVADGIIDDQEVALIRRFVFSKVRTRGIDLEEVLLLFGLNDACNSDENCDSWSTLFVEAISSYILHNENSYGIIDEREATFLLEQLYSDGEINDVEKKLLEYLKIHAVSYPPSMSDLFSNVGI